MIQDKIQCFIECIFQQFYLNKHKKLFTKENAKIMNVYVNEGMIQKIMINYDKKDFNS